MVDEHTEGACCCGDCACTAGGPACGGKAERPRNLVRRLQRKFFRPRQLAVYVLAFCWVIIAHPKGGALLAAGVSITLAGELLRVWATGHIRKNAVLTLGGPYRYIRDPMYLGSLMIGTGLGLAGHGYGVLAAFLAVFFLIYMPRKRRREVRRLMDRFGSEYTDYLAAVDSLVPRLGPYNGARKSSFSLRQCLVNHEHFIAALVVAAVALLTVKSHWHPHWLAPPSWLPPWI